MTARERWWAAIACAGLAAAVAGTGGLLLTRHGTPGLPRARRPGGRVPRAAAPIVAALQAAQPPSVAAPAALTIPEIGVRTRLITLGLTAQGTVQVPPTTSVAGWYTRSPRPGAVGPAIILGHIDSTQGPGVFFRLAGLRPGDPVYVRGPTAPRSSSW